MVGSVVALLHPGIDVGAALDLPFVDVRDMVERLELLAIQNAQSRSAAV